MNPLFMLIVVVAAMVVVPIALLWALNILFGLNLPFTFDTWLASFVLVSVVGGFRSNKG